MINQNVVAKISDFNFTNMGIEGLFDFFKNTDEFKRQTHIYNNQKILLESGDFYDLTENDGNSYPAAIISIYIECKDTGCWIKKIFVVSPFGCYWHEYYSDDFISRAISDKYYLNNFISHSIVDDKLTKIFRNYLVKRYGNLYKDSCIKFVKNATNIAKNSAKECYEKRISLLEDRERVELDSLSI